MTSRYVFAISTDDMHDALVATLPHAGTDSHLPDLCGVQFHVHPDRLDVIATDRYSVAIFAVELDGMPIDEPDKFVVPPADAKAWIKLLKAATKTRRYSKSPDVSLSRDVDAGTATIEIDETGVLQRTTVRPLNDPYYNWRKLLTDPPEHGPAAFGIAPGNIAKLGKAGTFSHALRFEFDATGNPLKPITITNREEPRFTALVMPVNLREGDA